MESIRRTLGLALLTMLIFGIVYPAAMVGLANVFVPKASKGNPIYKDAKLIGFEQVGQSFNSCNYFWSRPSAVGYDGSGTGGSNLGPTNPDFLQIVSDRIDTLLAYHPGLTKEEIPVDLVTTSGSGLDPNISKEAALIQVNRVAKVRGLNSDQLIQLIADKTEEPLLGLLGPGNYVNVLLLNLALDHLSNQNNK